MRAPKAMLRLRDRGGARARAGMPRACMTPKPRLLVHTSRQAIRWGDMDMLGHVNNTSYFRYFEQARIEWLYGLQGSGDAFSGTGPSSSTRAARSWSRSCIPATSRCGCTWASRAARSVGSYYELTMNGRTYADGAAKIVWIDLASGRSVPVARARRGAASRAAMTHAMRRELPGGDEEGTT